MWATLEYAKSLAILFQFSKPETLSQSFKMFYIKEAQALNTFYVSEVLLNGGSCNAITMLIYNNVDSNREFIYKTRIDYFSSSAV